MAGPTYALRPYIHDLLYSAPPGPNKFKLGWRDGCETGISAAGNHRIKFYYKFTQQYTLVSDHAYYTGWKNGWNYCQRYLFQHYTRKIL